MSRTRPDSYGPIADTLIETLRDAKGQFVSKPGVLRALYGQGGEDGPKDEAKVLRVVVCRLRKLGFQIECVTAFRILPQK